MNCQNTPLQLDLNTVSMRRPLALIAVYGLVLFGWPVLGHCQTASSRSDCSPVYEAGLAHERAGRLRDAMLMFQDCAAESCENPARVACQARLFRLELDTPSVVPLVIDATGAPLVDVQVTLDGVGLTSRLDGRAFPVDPGLHEFAFSIADKPLGSRQVVIAQGQRNRELCLSLPNVALADHTVTTQSAATTLDPTQSIAPAVADKAGATSPVQRTERDATSPTLNAKHPPTQRTDARDTTLRLSPLNAARSEVAAARPVLQPQAPGEQGRSIAPYLLGGGALLSAGAYLALSSWARADNHKLSECTPNCAAGSVEHIRSLYLAADVALGVAAAAALGGVAFWIYHSADADTAPRRSVALSLQPQRTGALATLKATL